MIKLLIIGLLTYGIKALTEEEEQLMMSLHKECVAKSGATEDIIKKGKAGEFPQDNNLKCFMKCVFDEVGVIGDDGKIDIDGVVAILPESYKEIGRPVLEKCGTQDGADLCDSIFNTMKCYYDTDKRTFFLP